MNKKNERTKRATDVVSHSRTPSGRWAKSNKSLAPLVATKCKIPTLPQARKKFITRLASPHSSVAIDLEKGFTVLQYHALEGHGNFTKKVRAIIKKGLLGLTSLRTVQRVELYARAYLFKLNGIMPTIADLRRDPTPLFGRSARKPTIIKNLRKWGCKCSKDILAYANPAPGLSPQKGYGDRWVSQSMLQGLRDHCGAINQIISRANFRECDDIFRELIWLSEYAGSRCKPAQTLTTSVVPPPTKTMPIEINGKAGSESVNKPVS